MVGLFGFVGCSGVTMGSVVHYCLMAFQSVVKSSLLVLRLLSCQSNQHFGVYQKGESHVRLGFVWLEGEFVVRKAGFICCILHAWT